MCPGVMAGALDPGCRMEVQLLLLITGDVTAASGTGLRSLLGGMEAGCFWWLNAVSAWLPISFLLWFAAPTASKQSER